jgi:hypothetical protein
VSSTANGGIGTGYAVVQERAFDIALSILAGSRTVAGRCNAKPISAANRPDYSNETR